MRINFDSKSLVFSCILCFTTMVHLTARAVELESYFNADTLRAIDTLVKADEWRAQQYSRRDKKGRGYSEQKTFFCRGNKLTVSQDYSEKKDLYKKQRLYVNGKRVNINRAYKKAYGISLPRELYFMRNNLVVAEIFDSYLTIKLVLAENNCLGDFCNDVEILTINIDNNEKVNIQFHSEYWGDNE